MFEDDNLSIGDEEEEKLGEYISLKMLINGVTVEQVIKAQEQTMLKVILTGQVLRGKSARNDLVRQAKSYSATAVIFSVSETKAFGFDVLNMWFFVDCVFFTPGLLIILVNLLIFRAIARDALEVS
ncbi:hypothetical protein Tco_0954620 [Tanacetum coccineum]|uniref:Uncharacterized protein n=1 Tax=Tanacetum coccineum TaxID=301880 RepID=A0ABQ5E4X3_9ASTR